MPGGFEVADGYVTIHARIDDAEVEAAATKVAHDLDTGIASDFKGTSISKEFEKVGGTSGTSFRSKAHTEVDKLGNDVERDAGGLFKSLSGAFEKAGVEAGDLFGNGIMDGAQSGFKVFAQLPPEAQAAIAAGAIAAGILFGTVIETAIAAVILGAVGGLGLAAGIMAEASDPRVKGAFDQLKTNLSSDLKSAASSFIEPLESGAAIISAAFDKAKPDLTRFFEEISPSIDRLAAGVGGLVEQISSGLAGAGTGARQVLDAIAEILPVIGSGVREFFDEINAAGPGAAELIKAIGFSIATTIAGLGNGIMVAGMLFNAIVQGAKSAFDALRVVADAMADAGLLPQKMAEGIDRAAGGLDKFADNSKSASSGASAFGQSAGSAASSAQQLATSLDNVYNAFRKVTDANLQADESSLSYKKDLAGLTQSVQQNGHSLDTNTAAGRANMQAFQQAAGAAKSNAEAVRDQALAAGKTGVQAAGAYSSSLAANAQQLARTAQAAGLNKDATADMISKYLGIPKNIATLFTTPGSDAAKQAADALEKAILGIPSYKRIDIEYSEVHYTSYQQIRPGHGGSDPGGGTWLGSVHHAAAGGIFDAGVYSGGPILFAEPETGGEAFIPRITPDPARRLAVLAEAASWAGMQLVPAGQSLTPTSATPASDGASVRATVNQYFGYDPGAERAADMRRQAQAALAVTR